MKATPRKKRIYTAVERQRSVDAGRDRIIAAARELLDSNEGDGFSIDAVARRAGVARMTVYNQFESKAGLLEALFDALAEDGPFGEMAQIFALPDPEAALDEYVAVFGRFWTLYRRTHRHLRVVALHDDELARAMAERNERRRKGITAIVRRLAERARPVVPPAELVEVLYVLLGFETFDAVAGPDRTPTDVIPVVRQLVRATLGLPTGRARR